MKNLIKNLVVISLLSFSVSCGAEDESGRTCVGSMVLYGLKNESSHTVSVVFKNGRNIDSLVLLHGEEEKGVDIAITEWTNAGDNRVYYDDRYVVKFNEPSWTHRPELFENFKSFNDVNGIYYLFTFIDDDYRFAVENGVDLEAEK